MVLGNTSVKNKGSSYTTKRIKETTDYVRAEECHNFSLWVENNYNSLQEEVESKFGNVDNDIFHETYMNIYDLVIYSNLNIDSYRGYFMRSYATNLVKRNIAGARYNYIEHIENDKNFTQEDSSDDDANHFPLNLFLEYVEKKYTAQDYELYKMYMLAKPKQSYKTISSLTNMLVGSVRRVISSISKDLKKNKDEIMKEEFSF